MKQNFKNKQKPIAIIITILLSLGLPAATALAGSSEDMPDIVEPVIVDEPVTAPDYTSYTFSEEEDPVFSGGLDVDFISLQD
jgi:hypothetical protein